MILGVVQLHPHLSHHIFNIVLPSQILNPSKRGLMSMVIGRTRWIDNNEIGDIYEPLDLELLVAEAFRIEAGSLGPCPVNCEWFVLVRSEQEKLVLS